MKRLLKQFKRQTANHNKITFGVNRHMFPEFWGVSDEDAKRIMREHSDQLAAERYKAEAWDELKGRLTTLVIESNNRSEYTGILDAMDAIYKEIEEADR